MTFEEKLVTGKSFLDAVKSYYCYLIAQPALLFVFLTRFSQERN